MRKKSTKKVILVGDFNLPHINWSDGTGVSTIDNTFLNGFAENGMVQCLHSSTHNKGSILDILLSKSEDHVCNLKVLNDKAYCYSDHYPITFDIKTILVVFVAIFPSAKFTILIVPIGPALNPNLIVLTG